MILPPASVRSNPNGSRQWTQKDRREAERGRRRLNQRKRSTKWRSYRALVARRGSCTHVPGIQFRARRLRRLQQKSSAMLSSPISRPALQSSKCLRLVRVCQLLYKRSLPRSIREVISSFIAPCSVSCDTKISTTLSPRVDKNVIRYVINTTLSPRVDQDQHDVITTGL